MSTGSSMLMLYRRYVCCNFNYLSVNLSQDGLCSVVYNMVVLV